MAKKIIDTVAQAQKKHDRAKVNLDKANKEFNDSLLKLNMVKNGLTEDAKKDYVESGYGCCPKCKSTNVEGGSLEMGDNQVWQVVNCIDCGLAYQDIYTLTDVEVQ